jgi:hypothetical protein
MDTRFPTQTQLQRILRDLRRAKSELAHLDCKETLHLKEAGESAQFIRNIAGLANTGRQAYLLIGIENKSWRVTGIGSGSPLLDCEATQQQMNQILASRIDPPLSVGYRTYPLEGAVVGLVSVVGKKPPYIVAISDDKFGGRKTSGREVFVRRGEVYVRVRTDTLIANRQSQLIELMERQRDLVAVVIALVFIAAIIGAGAGLAASTVQFAEAGVAGMLGSVGGLAIGWIFNERLVRGLGTLHGQVNKLLHNVAGPAWGALIGTLASYTMVDTLLSGRTVPLHPLAMALFVGPFSAVFLAVVLVTGPLAGLLLVKVEGLLQWRRRP